MENIEWLFFDMGGTLAEESVMEAQLVSDICEAFTALGHEYSEREVYSAMKTASAQYQSPLQGAIRALAENQRQYEFVAKRAKYQTSLERLYPDAEAVLPALANKFKLGIIANQDIGAVARLECYGIRHHFSVLALSAERGVSKPDSALFQLALAEAGCAAQEAAYIGDRLDNDIHPANMLGFTTVRVLQGLGRLQVPRSAEYQPHYQVEGLP